MKNLWPALTAVATIFAFSCAHATGDASVLTKVVVFNAAMMSSPEPIKGNCWTQSIASGRTDAYRCMAGNAIYDPCFADGGKFLACPTDAAANTGVRIVIAKLLPKPAPDTRLTAWQMELAGGAICRIGTGTTIPGYPFYCSGNVVCVAPPAGDTHEAVFVQCGRPQSGTSVADTSTYLATTIYE